MSALPPQNPPPLAISLKFRSLLLRLRKQLQRPQPLKHFHRKHIPGIFGHDIRNQSINVLRAISPERMIVRAKTVPAVLAFAMRRLHLHPSQASPAIHHKVIPVAIAPGLRHRKSQTRDFRQKRRLRNLPPPLSRNHRPPPLDLRPNSTNLRHRHQIPNHHTDTHHRFTPLTTRFQLNNWAPRFSPLLREVGDTRGHSQCGCPVPSAFFALGARILTCPSDATCSSSPKDTMSS